MIIITAIPNYNNALNTSFVCNTKVIESIRGREYRVGSVTRPLVTQRFTVSNLSKPLTQKFITWRNSRGESAVAMPVWLDAVYLQGGAKKNDLSLVCAAKYRLFQWFKYAIILYDSDTYEVTMIRKPIASNESLALEYKVSRDYPKGSVVAPLAFGKMLLPELGYYTPSISELMLEFEERVAIDINIIRDGSGNPVGVETDGEGGLVQSDTPVGIIEHFPIISPETDPDNEGGNGGEDPGGEDPGGEDPGGEDPEDPPSGPRDKSTNQPISDTTEHLFELPIEVDEVYNIYAGAAVCAVGLSNPQSLLKYKVEDETGYYHNGPTGGLSANTKWNNIEIVFAVRLVPKDGVSDPYEEREISISFDNGEQQTLYANSVYTSYIVLPQPVTLSTDDMLAVRVAIYGDSQTEPPTLPGAVPFSKTTVHTLFATQFVDGVYNFNTTIKNCPFTTHAPENGYCSNHDWQKNESQSNGGLWAGTATLGALES